MAVRPVDSLTMLPRLNEAGKMAQQHDQQPYSFQQVLGTQIQERADRARTQVKQKANAEQPVIDRERQNKSGQWSGPRGERQKQVSEDGSAGKRETGSSSGRLDVRV